MHYVSLEVDFEKERVSEIEVSLSAMKGEGSASSAVTEEVNIPWP